MRSAATGHIPLPDMQLHGVTMVRNEADIVELFVRHNLSLLDGMTIVDHGSSDATPQILAALVGEGLPLTVVRDDSIGLQQQEITTRTAREAFARTGADWVFPLDADEFIKSPSRHVVEQVLATVPPGIHAAVEWLTYVPDLRAGGQDMIALTRAARRLATERHLLRKAIVSRSLVDAPEAMLASGNHMVRRALDSEDDVPHALAHPAALALAHLPIRSVAQFSAKVITNHLARIVAGREITSTVFHLGESYRMLRDGQPLAADYVMTVAANYGVPRSNWAPLQSIALLDDPFVAPIDLRYTPAKDPNALALLARLAERLVDGERA